MVRTLIIFLSITKNHRIKNHEFIVTNSNVHPPFTVRCDDEIHTIGKWIARKSPIDRNSSAFGKQFISSLIQDVCCFLCLRFKFIFRFVFQSFSWLVLVCVDYVQMRMGYYCYRFSVQCSVICMMDDGCMFYIFLFSYHF